MPETLLLRDEAGTGRKRIVGQASGDRTAEHDGPEEAVVVNQVPEPDPPKGKRPVGYYDPATGDVTYDYKDAERRFSPVDSDKEAYLNAKNNGDVQAQLDALFEAIGDETVQEARDRLGIPAPTQ